MLLNIPADVAADVSYAAGVLTITSTATPTTGDDAAGGELTLRAVVLLMLWLPESVAHVVDACSNELMLVPVGCMYVYNRDA